jgi:hypothetical protein
MELRRNRPKISKKYKEERNAYIAWKKSLKQNITSAMVCGIYFECFSINGRNYMNDDGAYYQTVELLDASCIDMSCYAEPLYGGSEVMLVSPQYYFYFEDILSEDELSTMPAMTEYNISIHAPTTCRVRLIDRPNQLA